MRVTIPEFCLVVLAGASGSGKSSFAREHFAPTETISSDDCRALVRDDATALDATDDAFDVLHLIARKRLAARRLTVVDATNVRPEDRKRLVGLAREYHALAVAVVFDLPEKLCRERNAARPDREFGPHVVRNQIRTLAPACAPARPRGLSIHVPVQLRGRGCGRRDRAAAPVDGPARRARTLRHRRGRPRLLRRARRPAPRPRLRRRALERRGRRRPLPGIPPRGPAPGLPRRPRGPRPEDRGLPSTGHGCGRQRRRALRPRKPRGQAAEEAARPGREDKPRPGGDDRAARGRAARVPRPNGSLHRRPGQPLRARRRPAGRRPRGDEGGDAGAFVRRRALLRADSARPPGRRTSSACPSATTGPRSTGGRPWSSMATPRSRQPSGSTAPSASTPAASSAGV